MRPNSAPWWNPEVKIKISLTKKINEKTKKKTMKENENVPIRNIYSMNSHT